MVPAGLQAGDQQIVVYWSDRSGNQASVDNLFSLYSAFQPRVFARRPSEGYVSGNTAVRLVVSDLLSNGALPTDASDLFVRFCDKAAQVWSKAVRLYPGGYLDIENWLKTSGRSSIDIYL